MKIACLGDSCTFGQNVRADQAWPHLLWRATGHDVRNLGVNGDTTRLGLERFHRDVELLEPDVVVLQFGHNDANLWDGKPRVSAQAYAANLLEMVVRSSPARVIIYLPHFASAPKDAAYNYRIANYERSLGLRLNIPILDDGYGVHPDIDGHKMYANSVAEIL